ncbi:MAG: right-handed parallel beta-helix repeat-containing protein [Bacteroidales bacterium]|nr:right-handed parallel beta-helix repeat-containing protein [Bacteroidales bacterium]
MRSFQKIIPYIVFSCILACILMAYNGCTKENLNTDPAFRLEFSNDTILFDTVFTSIGSATKPLLVRNKSNQKVIVESIRLARGSASPYRINIDGQSAFEVKDLEIGPNDSAFIFVKVTIDPNNQDNPLIQTDSILFLSNGNHQDVKLVSWGQDAWFHANDTLRGSVFLGAEKPHVIYGNLVVDSLCTLNIEQGARLYFHNNSGLIVRNSGTIRVNGTLEKPVQFRADRLDEEYETVSGQWLGILIEGESTGNLFEYADIRNGRYGVALDSTIIGSIPNAIFMNCIIHNMVNFGILSTHSNIRVYNSQISNCGGYTVAIDAGGKCEFRHCTLSNYWSSSSKQFQTLLLSNNYYSDGTQTPTALEEAYFGNCIIMGNGFEEIILDSIAGSSFNVMFDNCLVQTEESSKFSHLFVNCIINEEAAFVDPWIGQFELDTLSFAKDAGSLSIISTSSRNINSDLKGNSRLSDAGPDLGCYERIEEP